MTNWWQEPFRVFQTNLREIDAGLDVEQVLDDLRGLHANAWLLNTGGIVSFYPSRLPYQHPSPWLAERESGDLLGDAVSAAHRRGVRVISRFDFSKLHGDVYEQHPDWFFLRPDGQPQVYNGLYSACPSGPYNQEHSLAVLGEVLERYPIDGVFFNMFGFAPWDYSGNYHGVCQCANCRRRFAEQYGRDLPPAEDWDDPAWVDYLEFARRTAADLSARLRDFIHQQRPDVALVLFMNAGEGDVVVHEINNAIQRPLPYWAHNTGEKIKLSQGQYPGRPVAINSVLFLDIPYRFASEQPAYIGLRLAQMLAHGANPYTYVIGTTRQPDRRNQAVVRELYAYHERQAETFTGLVTAARCALVLPERAQSLYNRGRSFDAVTAAFRGLYRALTESHIPFDVFADRAIAEKAASGALEGYDLLALPNAAWLSDAEGQALDGFVAAGGKLLATFESGLYDERGRPRRRPLLSCLGFTEALRRRDEMRSAVLRIRPADRPLLPGLEDCDLLALLGAYLYVQAAAESVKHLPLIPPMRYGPPEKCYWETETGWPGALVQASGAGRAAYLPWQPDRFYYSHSLPEYRALLAGLALRLAPEIALISTNAGPAVEMVLRDQPAGGRRVLSLVNYSGQNGRAFFEPVEMRDLEIGVACPRPSGRVWATRLEQELDFEEKDGFVHFRLPRLGLFERVVISET
jgi:hypothetical protein